jgi:hypothetical protein
LVGLAVWLIVVACAVEVAGIKSSSLAPWPSLLCGFPPLLPTVLDWVQSVPPLVGVDLHGAFWQIVSHSWNSGSLILLRGTPVIQTRSLAIVVPVRASRDPYCSVGQTSQTLRSSLCSSSVAVVQSLHSWLVVSLLPALHCSPCNCQLFRWESVCGVARPSGPAA